LDLANFNFNLPIDGLNGGEYLPLRAFTKKPQYTATGIAKYSDGSEQKICDPFCNFLTPFVTMSDELCLDNENTQDQPCFTALFSLVPPFTDLTYPEEILPPSSSSPNLVNPILIIVLSGLGGCLLLSGIVLAIVITLQRRKRKHYEKISEPEQVAKSTLAIHS